MRISDLVKNENQTVKWIKEEFEKGNLFVDNTFQRRYVWLQKHQINLIETILTGYVIPEIYIWEVGTDAETGDTKYSIVDGQQRIGAIVKYIKGEYKLTRAYLKNKDALYAGKRFSELNDEDKKNIWSYTLSFRRILSNVERDDIINIFLRLNSTDKSLNPQELRNAEYDGLFLQNAIKVADYDFWTKYNVFTLDSLRRMGDVEFVSSILIFLRKGIESEHTPKAVNEIYDLYNEKYDEADADREIIIKILDCLDDIAQNDESAQIGLYIKKTTHLYTMIVALYKYLKDNDNLTDEQRDNFINFYKKYERSNTDIVEEYKTLLQGGTSSKQNRMQRVKILRDIIDGKKSIK